MNDRPLTIRPDGSAHSHYVSGSAPGWAHCDLWVRGGTTLPPGTAPTCPNCAARDKPREKTTP